MTFLSKTAVALIAIVSMVSVCAHAADSVDVTFRYSIAPGTIGVSLRGEFNGWGTTPMVNSNGSFWTSTVRLRVGGQPSGGIPGAYQYKFWSGTGSGTWVNDPLNQHVNPLDNDNSYLYLKDPVVYQLIPNQRNPVVHTSVPTISAYLYPRVGTTIDTGTIHLTIDGTEFAGLGAGYDTATGWFAVPSPVPLVNGSHTVIVRAGTAAGGVNADTVTFTTQAGWIQITSQGNFATRNPSRLVRCVVADQSAHTVRLIRNAVDTLATTLSNGVYSATVALIEGANVFTAITDSTPSFAVSAPVTFTYVVNHNPTATASTIASGGSVSLDASASTDPDGHALSFRWLDDPMGPPLGLAGLTGSMVAVPIPAQSGEYYFGLIASDSAGNADTLRSLFVVNGDGSLSNPTIADNPSWARQGRIYFLFPKSFTAAGTIPAATERLHYIKDLGFNIIWLMPVMKNAYPINQGSGPGYNIVDFNTVAPEYGTNQDLKNFVDSAHALGVRVILDITPNHTSRFHPWSQDAHTFLQDSRYWTWYEHGMITANTNGLGDCLDASGFNYYCGFSDQLLNVNWSDIDLRTEMINVYKFWITTCGIDGYRFDVYWGPHRRYGEVAMGKPVRDALKHIKPDILLLGEDSGTGVGTEAIFADHVSGVNGGLDAAYDFTLFWGTSSGLGISNFGFNAGAINGLDGEIGNSGYYPGPHALYLRYMEDQDEDAIFYLNPAPSTYYDADPGTAYLKTMPMSTVLFTSPGLPMLWNGQEIGWGYGIAGTKEARSRSTINWAYPGAAVLAPYYQKVVNIRRLFPAFSQHKRDTNSDGQVNASDSSDCVRVATANPIVYAFTRPYWDQNGLTVVNFSPSQQSATLDLSAGSELYFTGGIQPGTSYYLNELYGNTHQQILGSALSAIPVTLQGYGVAVYSVSTTVDSLPPLNPILGVTQGPTIPHKTTLTQNYPNPFNPSTTIEYDLASASHVTLKVFDLLGREVSALVNKDQPAGRYSVMFNAGSHASGMYIYRLETLSPNAGSQIAVRKMLFLK